MRVEWMSTMVTLGLSTMEVTTVSLMSRALVMTVPEAERLYEFFTRTAREPALMAGCIASGWSTCTRGHAVRGRGGFGAEDVADASLDAEPQPLWHSPVALLPTRPPRPPTCAPK
jgi:hypothetical protein